jgi:hypothetical protein
MTKLLLATLLLAAAAFPQDDGGQSAIAPQQPGQQAPPTTDATGAQPAHDQEPPDKRVFGVLPNYRTANETAVYTPISVRQKFVIASKDSFDYPLVLLAGAIAGLGQLTNQNPSFGQGLAGYGRRLGTGYADQAIGNMMTEAMFPTMLREDPRYFRRGYGSKWSRAWYAATRVFVTRTDTGGHRFNYSEVLGNATGGAISNLYYPDGRNAADNALRLGEQIGVDSVSQVLKEFWPDVKHWLFHRHKEPDDASLRPSLTH